MATIQVLQGHTSPETAYVVADYPYGFKPRTQIRYWIEYKESHGCRLVSQTLNPKTGAWNKPKTSTYSQLAVLVLNRDNSHVETREWTFYDGGPALGQYLRSYETGLCEGARLDAKGWAQVYEARAKQAGGAS